MTTTAVSTVTAGQTVRTIPSRASGCATAFTHDVTGVEHFSLGHRQFVTLLHNGGSFTSSADTVVEVL